VLPLRFSVTVALTGFLLGAVAQVSSGGEAPSYRPEAAYKNLLKLQRGIKSSIAVIEVRTKMRSFPPMSLTFRGHSYFQAPDKQTVVFDNVPGILKGMVKDSPSLAPAAAWPAEYDVTVSGDDGTATTFHCEPRDPDATLASADVVVDDRTGEMTQLSFKNKNGSETTTQQTYQRIGGHDVIVSQSGKSQGPGYKADVETTFSDYQFNVSIPADVFAQR
jgi:hypothetical protein